MPDELRAASDAVARARSVVDVAARTLADRSSEGGKLSVSKLDQHQVVAYDLAHAAAAVEGSRVMCAYGEHGEVESLLARAYVADALHDVESRTLARRGDWSVAPDALAGAMDFVAAHRSPAFLETLADQCVKHGTGPTH